MKLTYSIVGIFFVALLPFTYFFLFSTRFFLVFVCVFVLFCLKEQDPGETAIGDSESHTSRDDLEYSLGNVKGEIAFPGDKAPGSRAAPEVTCLDLSTPRDFKHGRPFFPRQNSTYRITIPVTLRTSFRTALPRRALITWN